MITSHVWICASRCRHSNKNTGGKQIYVKLLLLENGNSCLENIFSVAESFAFPLRTLPQQLLHVKLREVKRSAVMSTSFPHHADFCVSLK